jgi:hypothetical protein
MYYRPASRKVMLGVAHRLPDCCGRDAWTCDACGRTAHKAPYLARRDSNGFAPCGTSFTAFTCAFRDGHQRPLTTLDVTEVRTVWDGGYEYVSPAESVTTIHYTLISDGS